MQTVERLKEEFLNIWDLHLLPNVPCNTFNREDIAITTMKKIHWRKKKRSANQINRKK